MATPGQIIAVGKLMTPGGKQGPKGDAGTAQPLADTTQDGLLRKVSGLTSDFIDGTNHSQSIAPQIWSVRLRSFNAIGNPNFEVDQRLCGAFTAAANGSTQDRWFRYTTGSMVLTSQQAAVAVPIPGTDFLISQFAHRTQIGTSQATLAAGDYFQITQTIEGPNHREMGGAHSLSLLVRSSVANLKFSLVLSDPTSSLSLVKLCNAGTTGIWNLIQLPNLPVMTGGGFSATPGVAGHILHIVLACGTTYMAPAADVWQNGNFLGAPGMSNFAASAANSTFDIAFVQHEPGPLCSTLIDKPFSQNLDECLRYYQKTYDYATRAGIVSGNGIIGVGALPGQDPYAPQRFVNRMAKAPNVYIYGGATGSVNAVSDAYAGFDRGVGSIIGAGETGYQSPHMTSTNAAQTIYSWQHVADTGW
jgi:hypothetical protein